MKSDTVAYILLAIIVIFFDVFIITLVAMDRGVVFRKYRCCALEKRGKGIREVGYFFSERSMRIWGGKKKRGKWMEVSYWRYDKKKEKWEIIR